MAITATAVISNTNGLWRSWTVTCLDADTGPVNLAHGMGVAPDGVFLTKIGGSEAVAVNAQWTAVADATNIALSKISATGSGGTTPGTTTVLKVVAFYPPSGVR